MELSHPVAAIWHLAATSLVAAESLAGVPARLEGASANLIELKDNMISYKYGVAARKSIRQEVICVAG